MIKYYAIDDEQFATIPCIYTPVYDTGNGYGTQYRVQLSTVGAEPVGIEAFKACKRDGNAYVVSIGCEMIDISGTIDEFADTIANRIADDMACNHRRSISSDEREIQRKRIARAIKAFA